MPVLTINGRQETVDAPKSTPLLWVIREQLQMTGTKFGCGGGFCGACTVHVDGVAVRSCQTHLGEIEGKHITTIEGLSEKGDHALQKAWVAEQVPQCGYCQSGMILAATALLRAKPKPTDADIDDAMTNICRCGTYPRIRAAIHKAAEGAI